jgi:REP element-mobilizing transposase RayT
MVLAYHMILSAYGFWLPNDPRGSWSTEVWAKDLKPFGDPVHPDTRRSVAAKPHDRAKRLAAKKELVMPPVRFNGIQANAIVNGIAKITHRLRVTVFALAIMPDYLHMVIARHGMLIEDFAGFVKRAGSRAMTKAKIHPHARFAEPGESPPTPWCVGGWFVYLNTAADITGRISYVENNPVKAGLKRQPWKLLQPYNAPRGRGG